ncbi:MAG: CPBP family intramembrane metalloprotease, partial [Planctomycetales bacterium]|nr:CPBP family intramembrane metalloprotease [Planctomycetales bacterium]
DKVTPLWGLLFVLLIALSPGFVEELLFRGYIQGRLLQRWRPAWAIGVTSVLFGLVHVAPHTVVLATVLGVWLGIVAWRTGSIVPTIVCHAFVNGSVNAWRLIVKFSGMSETVQYIGVGLFVAVGLVFFVIACRMLAANPQANEETPSLAADQAT